MVWHNIVTRKLDYIWTCDVVDTDMRKPEFEEYWIVFLVCMLVIFFMLGCAKVEHKEEVKTYPLSEEDPILEKLIEIGEVETI